MKNERNLTVPQLSTPVDAERTPSPEAPPYDTGEPLSREEREALLYDDELEDSDRYGIFPSRS
jgi:hypothetical protein